MCGVCMYVCVCRDLQASPAGGGSSLFSISSYSSPSLSSSPPRPLSLLSSSSLSLQIRLFYDRLGHQLIVTVLGAKDLPGGEDLRPRNPYVKIYFLPDRR